MLDQSMRTDGLDTAWAGKRILVVDDHEAVRIGVVTALAHKLSDGNRMEPPDITAAASFAEAASIIAGEQTFDIAVVDLILGDRSGLELISIVRDLKLPTRCIMLVANKTPKTLIAGFETGCVFAVVEKSQGVGPLVDAVHAAARGHSALTVMDVNKAKEELAASGAIDRSVLTARESMMADLVADGMSDAEIAERMFVSVATVRNTLSRMSRRLGLPGGRSRLAVAVWKERSARDSGTL